MTSSVSINSVVRHAERMNTRDGVRILRVVFDREVSLQAFYRDSDHARTMC